MAGCTPDAVGRVDRCAPDSIPTCGSFGLAIVDRGWVTVFHLVFDSLCPGSAAQRVVQGIRFGSSTATGTDQLVADDRLELARRISLGDVMVGTQYGRVDETKTIKLKKW